MTVHGISLQYLLHCLSLAPCIRALLRVPPCRISLCPSTKQSLQGGAMPRGTTKANGEKGSGEV